ncbi:PrgI family protein [Candidatus Saccharibacteria bacterium]|nr:PrgI family protein [Candidatus Saccharibacteria bacterium]
MARYKVPQDVEAEDKLLGPFTFRQFIYLLIAAAGIAGAWGLFQLFPLLALIPLPFVIFFGVLALPLKKDQPMETYLAAVVSFYLKPNRRVWLPGQRESTILITAPKQVEKSRTRNITEDEATHRLSFLANIVDTEGYAIRENGNSSMREEYAAEANAVEDVLDTENPVIDRIIEQEQTNRKRELAREMQTAVSRAEALTTSQPPMTEATVRQQFTNLANNDTFSVQTIANQANRIQQQAQQQQIQQPAQQPANTMQLPPQPMSQPAPQPTPAPQPVLDPTLRSERQFEENFRQAIRTPSIVQNQSTFDSMMPPTVAGLTPPEFTPMSTPLPHESQPGHYRPIQTEEETKKPNDRPDLYGPPTAIFS